MAARRLLIVMVVLLIASSVAAALVPAPEPEPTPPEDGHTDKPEPARTEGERAGRLVRSEIAAEGEGEEIRVGVGDQLALTVRSRRADQVEIPAFGAIEAVAADAPAVFDILVDRPGSFVVRLVEARRTIGRIEAEPRSGASRSARPGEARAEAGARPARRGRRGHGR